MLGMVIFATTLGYLHFIGTADHKQISVGERISNEYDSLSEGAADFGQMLKTFLLGSTGEDEDKDRSAPAVHVAALLRDFSHSQQQTAGAHAPQPPTPAAQSACRASFEPTCPMLSYVRFWNKEFAEEDCYRSPASHPLGMRAPVAERKYLVFEPDRGGWNNIRMAAETAIIFAHASGRILVLPPEAKWYLLNSNKDKGENHSDFEDFFDMRKIAETVYVISMEQFLQEAAVPGLLKVPFPGTVPGNPSYGTRPAAFVEGAPQRLWDYLRESCYHRHWEPGRYHIGFNLAPKGADEGNKTEHMNRMSLRGSARSAYASGSYDFNAHVSFLPIPKRDEDQRVKLHASHSRELIVYDAKMHSERAIYFPGDYSTSTRILTHFYTYLYWHNHHLEHVYKRLVRDRLHYHDEIFCAAGRVVRLLHEEAAKLSQHHAFPEHRHEVPPSTHRDPDTLSGNVHKDATFYAYHIRRGDFQYKDMKISSKQIYANTKHLLNANRTRIIYVSTDDPNHKEFRDLRGKTADFPNSGIVHTDKAGHVFHVRFLSDYIQKANLGHGQMNQNRIGMVEQVICANAHTFFGTPLSTFSGYITRMRGYYRDNRYANTYYTQTKHLYSLQTTTEIVGPFWAREFAVAHKEIDDDGVDGMDVAE